MATIGQSCTATPVVNRKTLSLISLTMSDTEPIVCAGGRLLAQARDSCADETTQLERALCANCEGSCASTRAAVEREARSFAASLVAGDLPPEQAVIQLKKVFKRLDGHLPSLVKPTAPRSEPSGHRGCCEWYSWTLTLCIDSYFDELQSHLRTTTGS